MNRDAVKLAQALMNSFGASVRDDGIWGQVTQKAWLSLSERDRSYISERVKAVEGFTISPNGMTVAASRKAAKSGSLQRVTSTESRTVRNNRSGSPVRSSSSTTQPAFAGATGTGWEGRKRAEPDASNFISKMDALALAEKWNAVFGLPTGTMAFMLDLEAQKVPGGYDPSYKGGYRRAYWGLYQFDNRGAAWQTARNFARKRGVTVPAFAQGWFVPDHNTAMGAAYAAYHAGRLRDAGMPVTPETLYACHQQGFGGFRAMVKSGATYAGPQSSVSVVALRKAVAQSKQVA